MAIRPIKRYGGFTPTGIDTSGVKRMQALAGVAGDVGELAVGIGKAKAANEAPLKAKQDIDEATSIDPNTGKIVRKKIKMKSGLGWGDNAYNKEIAVHEEAIRQQYLNGVNNDFTARQNELFDQYQNDPDGFIVASEALFQGVVSNVNPEYQGIVGDYLSNSISSSTEKLRSNKRANDIADTIQGGVDGLNTDLNTITAASAAGEDVTDLVEIISLKIESLSKLSPEQKRQEPQRKKVLKQKVYESNVSGELNRIAEGEEGPTAAFARLQEIENKPQAGYSNEEWKGFIYKQQLQLTRTNSLIEAGNSVATKEAQAFVNGVVDQARFGFPVKESDLVKAKELAVTSAQKKSISDAEQTAQYSLSSRNDRLKLYTTASENPLTADLAGMMAAQERRITSQLNADPLAFSIAQGIATEVEIDLLNPTPEQLAAATTQAATATIFQGVNVPILTSPQIDSLVAAWPELDAKAQANLANAYGPESFIWSKFSDKNAGVYAQGASNPNPNVRTQIFDGQSALNIGSTKFDGGSNAVFERSMTDVLGSDTISDQDYKDIFDASKAVYASELGQGTHIVNQTQFKNIIKSVIGDVPKIRNYKTILPYNVTADELEDYFDNMTVEFLGAKLFPEQLEETLSEEQQNKIANTLKLIQKDSRIKAISNDQYVVLPADGIGIFNGLEPLQFIINRTVIDDIMAPIIEEDKNKLSKEYASDFQSGAPGMADTPSSIPFSPGYGITPSSVTSPRN